MFCVLRHVCPKAARQSIACPKPFLGGDCFFSVVICRRFFGLAVIMFVGLYVVFVWCFSLIRVLSKAARKNTACPSLVARAVVALRLAWQRAARTTTSRGRRPLDVACFKALSFECFGRLDTQLGRQGVHVFSVRFAKFNNLFTRGGFYACLRFSFL